MRAAVFALLLSLACTARAEKIDICYGYDCAAHIEVEYSKAQLREIGRLFRKLPNAAAEREAVAQAVGAFYDIAGTQSPIWQDHGGNEDDDDAQGRMDCIDHSANTTAFLAVMEKYKWLRFHNVSAPVRRGIWNAHWAARLIEQDSGEAYVVDSWFFDPGEPAAVFSLEEWRNGASPQLAQKKAEQ